MDPKADWVLRVLGVDVAASRARNDPSDGPAKLNEVLGPSGTATTAPAPDWKAARAQVEAALATVGQQIAALQKAIRRTNDDELLTISEIGLQAMVADFKPALLNALSAAGDGDAASLSKQAPALLQAVQRVGQLIGSDARIAACDGNDFGVAVSIQATLAPALAAVSAAVEAEMKS